jgi:electron transfer flavoprotein alpha subunit
MLWKNWDFSDVILSFIEHDRGALSSASLQMLSCAGTAAHEAGALVHAVAIGGDADTLRDSLRRHGVSHIYQVRHPALEEYAPIAWARSITQLMKAHSPSAVMAAGTDRGNEILAWVGAITGLPMAANCVEFRSSVPTVVRHRWGGSLLEEASVHGQPAILTVALFAFEAAEAGNPGDTTLEVVAPTIDEKDLRVRVVAREETVSSGVNLQTARVVVGGGRGVGSAEGFRVLEELAAVLGGAVGGSRVATNNGWRPHSVQVGLTGNRIAPELYIACGISGAIQHLVGCKAAKRILVINKDREAPFFRRADYGVTGDLHEVIPVLIDEIRRRKLSAKAT